MIKYIEKVFNVKCKILLCPAGIDLGKIRKIVHRENVKGDKVRIGFLGSLAWWQGVDILAEAVAMVKEKLPNVELFIVGDGSMREEVSNLCRNYKIKYTITGFVPHEEALKYLKSFDVLVLPRLKTSVTEKTIPIKIIEAWALGVPVIVTRHRVFVEMGYRDQEHLIYCEPNPRDVAEAMLLLLRNDDLRQRLAENASKLAENYDYNKIAENILKNISEFQ